MVSRRSFIGAGASLLLAPLLKIQPAIDRHSLLTMFTDMDYVRYDLSRPYFLSGHAYATCGRTMARIDSNETELLDESVKIPPMERIWSEHYKPSAKWQKFELHDIADLHCHGDKYCGVCPACDDRWIPVPKDWLDEDGYVLSKYWNERNCDWETGEMRDRSCSLCRGEHWEGGWVQPVGDRGISYKYAKRLARIPGCEVAIAEPVTLNGELLTSVLFRSDLISGIVCCVRNH